MEAAGELLEPPATLRSRLRDLYLGGDRKATAFQLAQLAFDLGTVGFFIATSFTATEGWVLWLDYSIAAILTLDFLARLYVSPRPLQYLRQPLTIVDLVVIGSLLAPALLENLGFLRILRALRLLRSYNVLRLLEREAPILRQHIRAIRAAVNLLVFVFVVAAIVFVRQHKINPDINNYLDALYFTMATLTTTGFGDITLEGREGRVLSIFIMIFGISLFLQLVHAVFKSRKVDFPCPRCGLQNHDVDAVHCKACGQILCIPNPGD